MDQQEEETIEQHDSTAANGISSQSSSPVLEAQQQASAVPNLNKKPPKSDISGGWTNMTLMKSYLCGALKHAVYKPRGKPSDVWQRGIHAIHLADDTVIENWYICKRKDTNQNDCNRLFNLKLRHGNKSLREHCEKHDRNEAEKQDEKYFLVSYEQMVNALDKSNLVGDSYGLVSFREVLPRPEVMGNW